MAGSLRQFNFPVGATCLLCIVFSSAGCSGFPDQSTLGKPLSDGQRPPENVFCTISAGIWNCDAVTPKTPVQTTPVANEKSKSDPMTQSIRRTVKQTRNRKIKVIKAR